MYSIRLNYNSFTDASADAFINALKRNTTLKQLHLNANKIFNNATMKAWDNYMSSSM